jgi:branched-chain amino acid transport system permease protein
VLERLRGRDALVFACGLAVVAAMLAALPAAVSDYGLALMITILSYVVVATAWALFSGATGYISLATAAFFGIGAYSVAVLGERLGFYPALAIAGALCAVVAVIVSLSTLRLRGTYFVIFSFGLAELIRQLVSWWEINQTRTLGRYVYLDLGDRDVYQLLVVLCLATLAFSWWMRRTRFGYSLTVIGQDEIVARHIGIDTTTAKVIAFTVSSLIIGLAGAIMAPRWTFIDPELAFNPLISFYVLIIALLGGADRLYGPLVGTIPIVLLSELLSAKFPHYFSVLLGLFFVVIVFFLPRGLTGAGRDLLRLMREGRRPPAEPA